MVAIKLYFVVVLYIALICITVYGVSVIVCAITKTVLLNRGYKKNPEQFGETITRIGRRRYLNQLDLSEWKLFKPLFWLSLIFIAGPIIVLHMCIINK